MTAPWFKWTTIALYCVGLLGAMLHPGFLLLILPAMGMTVCLISSDPPEVTPEATMEPRRSDATCFSCGKRGRRTTLLYPPGKSYACPKCRVWWVN